MAAALKHVCTAALAATMAFPAFAEKVRVAYCFSPGFCEERAGGRVVGFNPAWIERIAASAGWEVQRVDCTFPEALEKLAAGEVDLLPAVPYTRERAGRILFSHLHCGILKNYLFVPRGAGLGGTEPSEWDGISVGVVSGSDLADVLPKTGHLAGFKPVFREYKSLESAVGAVMSGKCQGVACSSGKDILSKCMSIMELPGTPLFFGVSPSRTDLVERVDRAITSVYDEYPRFDHQLMTRYFPPVGMNAVPLTPAEVKWVNERAAAKRPVRVEISPERPPLKCRAENGEAAGFIGRLLREISRMTKLEFTCLEPTSSSEARQRFASGRAELWASFDAELLGLADYGIVVPTVDIPQVLLSLASAPVKPVGDAVIAVDRGNTDRVEAYTRLGIMDRVVMCESDEECVRAVLGGRADLFICSSGTASECIRKLDCEASVRVRPDDAPLYTPSFDLHVSRAADPELASLVSKAIRSLSRDELSAMMYSSGAEATKPVLTIGQIWSIISVIAILGLSHMAFWSHRASRRIRAALSSSDAALRDADKANKELRALNERGAKIRGVLKMLSEDYDNKSKILSTVRAAAEMLNADHATVVRIRSDGSYERMLCWQRDESQLLPSVRPGVSSRIAAILESVPKFTWPRPGAPDEPLLRKTLDDFGCASMSVTRLLVKGQSWGYASFMGAESGLGNMDMLDEVERLLEIAARRQLLDGEVEENRRELEKALSSAECAARAKTAFLSAMSHDIRTPLNAIIGFADLIGRPGLGPDELREYSEGVSRSSSELLTLVNDVLDLSKLDSARENQREGVCDFRKLFGELTAIYRVMAGSKKIKLVPRIANGFPLLRLSEQRMRQVMRKERPDIVFTDLWMPGMSGAELAAEIRGNPDLAEIPIVAVTADSDSDKTFDTAVFNRVITKPVTSAKVKEIFASLYPPSAPDGGEASSQGV